MRREKNFLIIIARVVFGLDIEEAKLSRVEATVEIFASGSVSVIPAGAARLRLERILPRCAGSTIGVPSSMAPSTSDGR
jgi:hypothetical protein